MSRLTSILAIAALTTLTVATASRTLLAQDEMLLHGGAGSIGFYAAPVVKLTELAGRGDVLGGVRAGIIFARRFAIGVAAYHGGGNGDRLGYDYSGGPMVINMPGSDFRGRGGDGGFGGGDGLSYGGLELEYIWEPTKLVHASISSLFGGGTFRSRDLSIIVPVIDNAIPVDGGYRGPTGHRDSFFVAEPGASAEVNVVKHVRLALGVGYRFAAGGDRQGVGVVGNGRGSVNGATGTLALKLGKL